MTEHEFEAALHFVLRDSGMTIHTQSSLAEALKDQIVVGASGELSFKVLDPNVYPWAKGGAAFLWSDVLTLGDIIDALGEHKLEDVLMPDQWSAVVRALFGRALFGAWTRMRAMRVELDDKQFRVMRAVKRGHCTLAEIAKFAELSMEETHAIIDNLKGTYYRDEIPLLESSEDGGLRTRF
jgi:hypothetical protein